MFMCVDMENLLSSEQALLFLINQFEFATPYVVQLVRGFGSIMLPIAGLHCLVNAHNRACSASSK